MNLQARLLDPRHFITLYGTTPPRADASPERITRAAMSMAERVRALPLDGLVIYDVQDEHERTDVARPFPFLPTLESRSYARQIQELTELATITYKCVVNMTEPAWKQWLSETRQDYGINCLSLVGSSSPTPVPGALLVDRAVELAAEHWGKFALGGVVIAERHSPSYNECERLLHKAARGCGYFVSQIVYHPEATIRLLKDYARLCRERDIAPRRIILTFAPVGRPRTMEFLKWLGVAISPALEQTILDDPAPFSRSIQICRHSLRAILEQDYIEEIPLGINLESVSIHKDEIEASVELVHTLHALAEQYNLISAPVLSRSFGAR